MNKNTQTFLKVVPVWAWAFFAVAAVVTPRWGNLHDRPRLQEE